MYQDFYGLSAKPFSLTPDPAYFYGSACHANALELVRHGLRQCVRSARFTLVTVLTLGLGIGATTSIFSAVYGILLRPLNYPAPERLVVPQSRDRITGNLWNVTWPLLSVVCSPRRNVWPTELPYSE